MHRFITRATMAGAFVLALANCQLLTNSYSVGASTGTLGPECAAVALCCPTLSTTEVADCSMFLSLGKESVCQAYIQSMPNGVCAGGQHDAGVINFDSGTRDSGTLPDAKGPGDSTSPFDTGSSDPLNGTWTLSEAECEGAPVTLSGTVTLSFSGTSQTIVEQTEDLSDGCVITFILNPATVTTSEIEANSGTVTCSSACTASDCTAGATSAFDVPYTLTSTSTFSYTQTVPTTSCAAGSETYVWSRD